MIDTDNISDALTVASDAIDFSLFGLREQFELNIDIADRINTVKIIELVFPDLNVKRGNLTKWIGLIIKNETSANKIIAVLGSP